MPTPIGHAVAGVAAGCFAVCAVAGRARGVTAAGSGWGGPGRAIGLLAMLGMCADLDFLVGVHRSATHSVGATVVAGLAMAMTVSTARLRMGLVGAAAYGSHVLLDWLGTDPGAPFGVMLLWPFSSEFYVADPSLFMRVCREWWLVECWIHNLQSVAWELIVLLPLATVAVALARRLDRRTSGG